MYRGSIALNSSWENSVLLNIKKASEGGTISSCFPWDSKLLFLTSARFPGIDSLVWVWELGLGKEGGLGGGMNGIFGGGNGVGCDGGFATVGGIGGGGVGGGGGWSRGAIGTEGKGKGDGKGKGKGKGLV